MKPIRILFIALLLVAAGPIMSAAAFAADGSLYFSNFRRANASPAGGIYHLSPDFKKITPVIPNLDQANGVALSPGGKTLWATEFAKNRLRRAILADPVTLSPIGAAVALSFHWRGSRFNARG